MISLSFFFVWRYFFHLVLFWCRVRSFGEEGGSKYIYIYIFLLPPQTVNNINPF